MLAFTDEFSKRIYRRCRFKRAEKICVIGDGAPWIWNIADEEFSEPFRLLTFIMPESITGMLPGILGS